MRETKGMNTSVAGPSARVRSLVPQTRGRFSYRSLERKLKLIHSTRSDAVANQRKKLY